MATVTGARLSELLGLTWQDVDLKHRDAASVHVHRQVDRSGQRQPLKTESAERSIELPRSVVILLLAHRARSTYCQEKEFVFTTMSGRPLGQRNVARALRLAQRRARDQGGQPTFPRLHESGPVPKDTVPSFHGFRHHFASTGIAAGDSAEELSWILGHKNSQVTRQVYVQEIKSEERRAMLRAKSEARYGSILGSPRSNRPQHSAAASILRGRQSRSSTTASSRRR